MTSPKISFPDLEFQPVTPAHWPDLVALFSARGNPNYCWCMRWRSNSAQYKHSSALERRSQLGAIVQSRVPVGVFAYHQGKPFGWCSIAPRETYTLVVNSTTLQRIDDLPVWSVVCFFVDRAFRKQSLPVGLLKAAVSYAISQDATVIEGYPVEPGHRYRFMGSPSVFEQAGFQQVAMAKNGRQIMRYIVTG